MSEAWGCPAVPEEPPAALRGLETVGEALEAAAAAAAARRRQSRPNELVEMSSEDSGRPHDQEREDEAPGARFRSRLGGWTP